MNSAPYEFVLISGSSSRAGEANTAAGLLVSLFVKSYSVLTALLAHSWAIKTQHLSVPRTSTNTADTAQDPAVSPGSSTRREHFSAGTSSQTSRTRAHKKAIKHGGFSYRVPSTGARTTHKHGRQTQGFLLLHSVTSYHPWA